MNGARRVRAALALAALGLLMAPVTGAEAAKAPATLEVQSVTVDPAKVVGGNTVTGTVTLNRAPDTSMEIFVFDSLDNDAVATVEGSPFTITAPATSGTFTVTTSPVDRTFRTALQALKGDGTSTVTPSATLHIVPTAGTDLITVVKATLSKSAKLTVVAESDDPSATLTAYLNDNPLGVLSNGRGTFQLPSLTSGIVQVRSDLGGCGQRSFPNGNGSSTC